MRAGVSTRSWRPGARISRGQMSQSGRLSSGEAAPRCGLARPKLTLRLAQANVLSTARSLRSAGSNLSAFANPARTLAALPSGLLRSAPPAVRFKAKSQATRNRRSRQGPAAFGAGLQQAEPCLSAAGPRSPGGPRTLKRPSSRRRWATAPEGRSGRGRIEPDGETR